MKDFFFSFLKKEFKTGDSKRCTVEKFKFSQILLSDKNATSLCSRNISTLLIKYPTIPQVNSPCTWGGHTGAAVVQCTALSWVLSTEICQTDGQFFFSIRT